MVVTSSQLIEELRPLINSGKPIRIRFYSKSYGAGSYYDDDVTLSKSGNDIWTSGLHSPLNMKYGSEDSQFLQQGKISMNDSKLYILGNVETNNDIMKINVGSPPTADNSYRVKEEGIISMPLEDPVYKKLYITKIGGTGSFVGESDS